MTTQWTFPAASSGPIDGVGTCAFFMQVERSVKSKSNYRNSASGPARGTWKDLRAFADAVSLAARAARPRDWVLPSLGEPLASRPVCVAVLFARTTLDAGNISKSILDAVESVLVANDAEVKAVLEAVERSRSNPGFLAAFAQLPAGTPLPDAVQACAQLAVALESLPRT